MITKNLPQVKDRMFFMDKEIIILKLFNIFQLAEIRYIYSPMKFMVDVNVLSQSPDDSSSISVKLLGGVK